MGETVDVFMNGMHWRIGTNSLPGDGGSRISGGKEGIGKGMEIEKHRWYKSQIIEVDE